MRFFQTVRKEGNIHRLSQNQQQCQYQINFIIFRRWFSFITLTFSDACADITEYNCRACWESYALLLVMLLPALIRSFLPVLLFSATLERFWSLYYSKMRQKESTSMKLRDTDTQTVCLVATTMLRSKPLKPAFLPILIPGFNVSKVNFTSLHSQWAWQHLAWQQRLIGVPVCGWMVE